VLGAPRGKGLLLAHRDSILKANEIIGVLELGGLPTIEEYTRLGMPHHFGVHQFG